MPCRLQSHQNHRSLLLLHQNASLPTIQRQMSNFPAFLCVSVDVSMYRTGPRQKCFHCLQTAANFSYTKTTGRPRYRKLCPRLQCRNSFSNTTLDPPSEALSNNNIFPFFLNSHLRSSSAFNGPRRHMTAHPPPSEPGFFAECFLNNSTHFLWLFAFAYAWRRIRGKQTDIMATAGTAVLRVHKVMQVKAPALTNHGRQALGVHYGCISVLLRQKPADKRMVTTLASKDQSSGVSTCLCVCIEITFFEQEAVDAYTLKGS